MQSFRYILVKCMSFDRTYISRLNSSVIFIGQLVLHPNLNSQLVKLLEFGSIIVEQEGGFLEEFSYSEKFSANVRLGDLRC